MKNKFSINFFQYCLGVILILTTTGAIANTHLPKEKAAHTYISRYENVLGTSMELKISTYSQTAANEVENIVLNEIRRLSKIVSAYDAESEFSSWLKTSGQPVHVSHELFQVMQLFDTWRMRT